MSTVHYLNERAKLGAAQDLLEYIAEHGELCNMDDFFSAELETLAWLAEKDGFLTVRGYREGDVYWELTNKGREAVGLPTKPSLIRNVVKALDRKVAHRTLRHVEDDIMTGSVVSLSKPTDLNSLLARIAHDGTVCSLEHWVDESVERIAFKGEAAGLITIQGHKDGDDYWSLSKAGRKMMGLPDLPPSFMEKLAMTIGVMPRR